MIGENKMSLGNILEIGIAGIVVVAVLFYFISKNK